MRIFKKKREEISVGVRTGHYETRQVSLQSAVDLFPNLHLKYVSNGLALEMFKRLGFPIDEKLELVTIPYLREAPHDGE